MYRLVLWASLCLLSVAGTFQHVLAISRAGMNVGYEERRARNLAGLKPDWGNLAGPSDESFLTGLNLSKCECYFFNTAATCERRYNRCVRVFEAVLKHGLKGSSVNWKSPGEEGEKELEMLAEIRSNEDFRAKFEMVHVGSLVQPGNYRCEPQDICQRVCDNSHTQTMEPEVEGCAGAYHTGVSATVISKSCGLDEKKVEEWRKYFDTKHWHHSDFMLTLAQSVSAYCRDEGTREGHAMHTAEEAHRAYPEIEAKFKSSLISARFSDLDICFIDAIHDRRNHAPWSLAESLETYHNRLVEFRGANPERECREAFTEAYTKAKEDAPRWKRVEQEYLEAERARQSVEIRRRRHRLFSLEEDDDVEI
eukprot:GFYU01003961.1.p1 GENE.GFYU01003961.1~~GFYU01003961.1.p1  ORF type:complete len:365 (-),score=-12.64 GFYU01003961.1:357-1451(-)